MSDEPQVTARLGKVHVSTWDREEGASTEEYAPAAAREFAAELLAAADEADHQAAAIAEACKGGHDWNEGSNLGDGEHAFTSWSCRREGCEAYRTELLLDFEGYPTVTLLGLPLSREQRIDAAGMRAAMQPMLRKALRVLDQAVLGEALPDPATGVGPFGIRLQVDPNVPTGMLIAVGSCSCGHLPGDHDTTGCTVPLGLASICQCEIPRANLIVAKRFESDATHIEPP